MEKTRFRIEITEKEDGTISLYYQQLFGQYSGGATPNIENRRELAQEIQHALERFRKPDSFVENDYDPGPENTEFVNETSLEISKYELFGQATLSSGNFHELMRESRSEAGISG